MRPGTPRSSGGLSLPSVGPKGAGATQLPSLSPGSGGLSAPPPGLTAAAAAASAPLGAMRAQSPMAARRSVTGAHNSSSGGVLGGMVRPPPRVLPAPCLRSAQHAEAPALAAAWRSPLRWQRRSGSGLCAVGVTAAAAAQSRPEGLRTE
jgi:hypothetical protein